MNASVKKVLVIDDDPVITKSFDRVLSERGYTVSTAAAGDEALRKVAANEYDVVFTDIKMPGMDGIEVAERVKARRPWTPVVIITGYGTADNEAKAKAIGVSDFLRKPLSPEMIENSARKALRVIPGGRSEASATVPAALPTPQLELAPIAPVTERSAARSLGMLLAAPFIGLAFIIAVPFAGLAGLAWLAVRALARHRKAIGNRVKNVALFFGAPFIGLAYVLAFPFIGLGLAVWTGTRAWRKRS